MGGVALASGTSACFYAIINCAKMGDNIVSARNLYGGTYTMFADILPTMGIDCTFVDSQDPSNFAAAINENTRAIFCESCSNPALEISDLEAIAKVAHDAGLPLIVDATFSTPYLTQTLSHGADIVVRQPSFSLLLAALLLSTCSRSACPAAPRASSAARSLLTVPVRLCQVHSLTKWLGGHGTSIGGIVVDSGKFDWGAGKHPMYTEPDPSYHGLRWAIDLPEPLKPLAYKLRLLTGPLRNLGACISPDNSWMALQGIETLSLRMDRHCENALAVAQHLSKHESVEWVRFPGLESDPEYEKNVKYLKGKGGSMVVFGVKGGKEAGSKFIDNLKLISHVANVGSTQTLAIHPATTTHSQLSAEAQLAGGIKPELVRLSVGIETVGDIITDLDKALAA